MSDYQPITFDVTA